MFITINFLSQSLFSVFLTFVVVSPSLMCTHTHIQMCTHTYKLHRNTYKSTHRNGCTHIHICTHTGKQTCTHTYIHAQTYTVYAHPHLHTSNTYVHMHIHTHKFQTYRMFYFNLLYTFRSCTHHPNSITKITLNILSINSLSAGQKTYTPVKQSKMPFPSINNELIIFKLVNSFTMRALGPC